MIKCKPVLETLEDRCVPSYCVWTGSVSSDWANASNWNSPLGGVSTSYPGQTAGNSDVAMFTGTPVNNCILSSTINSIGALNGKMNFTGLLTINSNLITNGTGYFWDGIGGQYSYSDGEWGGGNLAFGSGGDLYLNASNIYEPFRWRGGNLGYVNGNVGSIIVGGAGITIGGSSPTYPLPIGYLGANLDIGWDASSNNVTSTAIIANITGNIQFRQSADIWTNGVVSGGALSVYGTLLLDQQYPDSSNGGLDAVTTNGNPRSFILNNGALVDGTVGNNSCQLYIGIPIANYGSVVVGNNSNGDTVLCNGYTSSGGYYADFMNYGANAKLSIGNNATLYFYNYFYQNNGQTVCAPGSTGAKLTGASGSFLTIAGGYVNCGDANITSGTSVGGSLTISAGTISLSGFNLVVADTSTGMSNVWSNSFLIVNAYTSSSVGSIFITLTDTSAAGLGNVQLVLLDEIGIQPIMPAWTAPFPYMSPNYTWSFSAINPGGQWEIVINN